MISKKTQNMSEKFDDSIIKSFKDKMIRKTKKNGLDENFSIDEIEKLKKKYGYDPYGSIDERVNAEIIDELMEWCNDLDLSKL